MTATVAAPPVQQQTRTDVLVLEPVVARFGIAPAVLRPGRLRIGSSPDCDVFHEGIGTGECRLEVAASGTVARSHGLRIWLNNVPIEEARLRVGDRLAVGPVEFRVRRASVAEVAVLVPPSSPVPRGEPHGLAESSGVVGVGAGNAIASNDPRASLRTHVEEVVRTIDRQQRRLDELGTPASLPISDSEPSSGLGVTERSQPAERAAAVDVRHVEQRLELMNELLGELERTVEEDHVAEEVESSERRHEREELALRVAHLDTVETQLLDRERDLAQRFEHHADRQRELAGRASLLDQRERLIAERAATLELRSTEIGEEQGRLERDRERLAVREAGLDERRGGLDQREGQLDARRADLDTAADHLADERKRFEAERREHESALATRDRAIGDHERELTSWAGELTQRERSVEQREVDVERQVAEFSARETELGRRERELVTQSDDVEMRRERVLRREGELETREHDLERSEAEIVRHEGDVATARSTVDAEHRAVVADRESLDGERAIARAESDALAVERRTLLADRDALAGKRRTLAEEHRDVEDRLQARAAALEARAEHDQRAIEERSRDLEIDRAAIEARLAELEAWGERLRGEQGHCEADRTALDARLAAIEESAARLREEWNTFENERAAANRERDELASESRRLVERERELGERWEDLETVRERHDEACRALRLEERRLADETETRDAERRSIVLERTGLDAHLQRITAAEIALDERERELENREETLRRNAIASDDERVIAAERRADADVEALAEQRRTFDAAHGEWEAERTRWEHEAVLRRDEVERAGAELAELRARADVERDAAQAEIAAARAEAERVAAELVALRKEAASDRTDRDTARAEIEVLRTDLATVKADSNLTAAELAEVRARVESMTSNMEAERRAAEEDRAARMAERDREREELEVERASIAAERRELGAERAVLQTEREEFEAARSKVSSAPSVDDSEVARRDARSSVDLDDAFDFLEEPGPSRPEAGSPHDGPAVPVWEDPFAAADAELAAPGVLSTKQEDMAYDPSVQGTPRSGFEERRSGRPEGGIVGTGRGEVLGDALGAADPFEVSADESELRIDLDVPDFTGSLFGDPAFDTSVEAEADTVEPIRPVVGGELETDLVGDAVSEHESSLPNGDTDSNVRMARSVLAEMFELPPSIRLGPAAGDSPLGEHDEHDELHERDDESAFDSAVGMEQTPIDVDEEAVRGKSTPQRADQAPSRSNEDPIEDTVAAYMERLLARSREGRVGESIVPLAPYGETIDERVDERRPIASSVAPATGSTDDAGATKETPAPRHRQDHVAVRADIDSLRELANLSARSAIASHSWKQLKGAILAKGTLLAVCVVLTVVFLSAPWWSNKQYGLAGWMALAMSLVMGWEFRRSVGLLRHSDEQALTEDHRKPPVGRPYGDTGHDDVQPVEITDHRVPSVGDECAVEEHEVEGRDVQVAGASESPV